MDFCAIKKIVNFFTVKSKRKVYVLPHNNGGKDKYDLINAASDNLLCVLRWYASHNERISSVFYVECYCKERLETLRKEIKDWPFEVKLVLNERVYVSRKSRFLHKICNLLTRYSCKTWLSCTPHSGFGDKVKGQKYICLSYSTPLKSAIAETKYWDLSYIDYFLETSLLTASVHAAQYRNYLCNCPLLGFPRNDTLFVSEKAGKVREWIRSSVNVSYSKVIVYAPTYREYRDAYTTGCVLGFDINPTVLEDFLEKNDLLLIVKHHPLQIIKDSQMTPHIISYQSSYDYSLYDLLQIADLLVSDYSSIIHDYIITGKPVILDFFDAEKYEDSRGFAFDPIEYICPGPICYTFDSFVKALLSELENNTRTEKYYTVQKMFHKHIDNQSTERVCAFLRQFIE